MMKHNKRALKVLEEIKIHNKWGNPQKDNFQGFAYADSLNCIQAQVAEIQLNKSGQIKIYRITCVLGCGATHNPHLVHQQVERSIIFGLNVVLLEEINVQNGQIVESNYDNY